MATDTTMRILHLGFEDPRMPGAGGGSVRTHEINRRLVAAGHDVTVLTTGYPDAVERVQDGVHYVPVGAGRGANRLSRLAGYITGLPAAARRYPDVDLVVEDFFAPFSTMAAPLWTGRPTIGIVQWLHAREKARQYGLPFHVVERAGVRRHHHLIAVSHGTAERLLAMNPRLRVDVIGNGVDPRAFATTPCTGRDIVFLGRLELVGKGLDLLLDAWAKACAHVEGRLIVAGGGPDETRVRARIAELGLSHRVSFAGWVSGAEKFRLLASARLVVVPSRHETFGLVALEALASGTPVIAFDIPCLQEVVPRGAGWRIPPFDVEALADRIVEAHADHDQLAAAGRAGRAFAAGYDWDVLACRQADVYRAALAAAPVH
ncbi:glycosyltransferase family 4 protein [Pseudonocardia yunnanensis]|uniref:Glycosyltransferase family 4 protein n=1 Tax=Pseudonocardia yunnanensis TaxID=58107 RepID=A0ABW4EYI3_9PSEU